MLLKNNFVSCTVEKAFAVFFLRFLCLDKYIPDVSLTCYTVVCTYSFREEFIVVVRKVWRWILCFRS